MIQFFKTFGLGVLYVVTLPITLAILAIYAVYCLFVFIYMAIRNVIIFFAGGTPNGDMKEDVEAKRILLERTQKAQPAQNIYISPNSQAIYQNPTPAPEPMEHGPYEEPVREEEMYYPGDEELPIDNGDNNNDYVD